MGSTSPDETPRGGRWGVWFIRYGVGWILVAAGVILLIVSPGGFGVEGFGMAAGSGFSVLMLNFLYRLGVTGDRERVREEDARRYLADHGHWPDQARPDRAPPGDAPAGEARAGEAPPEGSPAPDGSPRHKGPPPPGGTPPPGASPARREAPSDHHGRRSGPSSGPSRVRRRPD